jgi:hypothetical protein
VQDQVTARRLRVVKYRRSAHGTNEYPFLIDEKGISVVPITSAGLNHTTSRRPELPVLLTSGHPGPAQRQAEASGLKILSKPYRLEELAQLIETVLCR